MRGPSPLVRGNGGDWDQGKVRERSIPALRGKVGAVAHEIVIGGSIPATRGSVYP